MDFADIKVGQIVTIKAEVIDKDASDSTVRVDIEVMATTIAGCTRGKPWVRADDIVSAEDPPLKLKVGDWVAWGWKGRRGPPGAPLQVVAIDEPYLWLRAVGGRAGAIVDHSDLDIRKVEAPHD